MTYTKGLAEIKELPCSKGGTMKFLIVDGTGIAVMCNKVGGAKVEEANARRLAALWNAAEDIGSTTSEIEEGVIQFAFELGERHAEVINAAKERIEKLEAEKAEMLKIFKQVELLFSCGVIDVQPNGITAPDGSDEGIVKGLPLVQKIKADIDAAIREAGGEE